MCKDLNPFFCHTCDTTVSPAAAVPDVASGQFLCPECDAPLKYIGTGADNPFPLTLGLKIIGVICRRLVTSGALDRLQETASRTPGKLDDFLYRWVAITVRLAAEL